MLWKSVWNKHDYSWNYGFESPVRKFSSEQAGHTIQSALPLCPWESLVLSYPSCRRGGGGEVPGVRRAEDIPCDGMWDREQKGGLSRELGIDFLRSQEPPIRVKRHRQGTRISSDWHRILFFQTCQCLKECAQVQASQTLCAFCPGNPTSLRVHWPSLGLLLRGSWGPGAQGCFSATKTLQLLLLIALISHNYRLD